MTPLPLRFATTDHERFVFTNDAGGYFRADRDFLDRYATGFLSEGDQAFLAKEGHLSSDADDLATLGHLARWVRRLNAPSPLGYLILVPTLRCNLLCDYCQVSRAPETARGFDWSETTVAQVLSFLDGLTTDHVKVEFQGGEPLLRLDLLERVRAFCRERFARAEFVVCTNLQAVSEAAWSFLGDEDTWISTSFDGTSAAHMRLRTKDADWQAAFEANLRRALDAFGPGKVSALPTIDPAMAPDPQEIIDAYAALGLRSVYLRRVNHQGFARKRFATAEADAAWFDFHHRFVEAVIRHNLTAAEPMEEYYLAHLVRRVVQGGHNGHVDLRNPNWLGADYLVIDHDGRLYPTDEARMVSRVGQVDLAIGHVAMGIDEAIVDQLNAHASNLDDPDCAHCAFQPYCGLDLVDDLSRYGRIDLPKHLTHHCRTHTHLFHRAFELIYSEREDVRRTLAQWLGVPRFSPHLAPFHA